MARTTAPSMWLPGFDPDTPEPPAPLSLTANASSTTTGQAAEPVETALVAGTGDADPEQSPANVRANWRVVAATSETAGRVVWPLLTRSDLNGLTGAVAKFEANCCHRHAATDRSQ